MIVSGGSLCGKQGAGGVCQWWLPVVVAGASPLCPAWPQTCVCVTRLSSSPSRVTHCTRCNGLLPRSLDRWLAELPFHQVSLQTEAAQRHLRCCTLYFAVCIRYGQRSTDNLTTAYATIREGDIKQILWQIVTVCKIFVRLCEDRCIRNLRAGKIVPVQRHDGYSTHKKFSWSRSFKRQMWTNVHKTIQQKLCETWSRFVHNRVKKGLSNVFWFFFQDNRK